MTQPIDHRTFIVAASVARSTGRTWSIAKAFRIGFPAFISEFRTAIAMTTVQRTGENPRTTRNGMLDAWTATTEATRPSRDARAGWSRIAAIVPRLVSA